MKRLMPNSLITFLQTPANANCTRADLFVITLPNGQLMYATDGQLDIKVPSGTGGWTGSTTTFSASNYGRWKRGPITSEASFDLNANTMSLTCVPQQGTSFPGVTGIGILGGAHAGLFDKSNVTVYTAYMPHGSYGNVSAGLETKFVGTLLKLNKLNRIMVEFDCSDPLYLLGSSNKVPSRAFGSMCPWVYGDSNCNPVGGIKSQNLTVASGPSSSAITPTVTTGNYATSGFYSQGVVKFTSGILSGLSFTVAKHASGTLQFLPPILTSPSAGDTFTVTAGCDLTYSTCSQKFGNEGHFGGEFMIPPPDNAL